MLTDEVARTLFEEYSAHRESDRGGEETGWVLMGLRAGDEAVVMATLPAGANRDAGKAHVRFDWEAQAVASRIVRQDDRRLTMLGVAHTHPGRLRSPSAADLRGDRDWVANLRGRDGVFIIGTADEGTTGSVAGQPADHVLAFAGLRFDCYGLADGDVRYRKLPVRIAIGPDLAASLRSVWDAIEARADRLESLAVRFRNFRFEVGLADGVPALSLAIGLGPPGESVRVLLVGKSARFFHETADGPVPFDLPAGTSPDHGVYLLLADLAARR